MMDIATLAWEYFGKSLSLNTVCRCIKKCNLKLYYAKRKAFINFAPETPPSSLGPKSSEMDERQWKHVLWSDESTFQLVFGKNGRWILRAKDEKDHPDCYQWKVQKPASVMVWGCISAHDMGDLHICEGTIDAEAYVGILERYMLPSRQQLLPGTPYVFRRTMPGLNLHELKQRGFLGIECVCLTGLPAVQIGLILKMYDASWRGESDNGNHGKSSRSSLVYTKNGQKFHLQNCNTQRDSTIMYESASQQRAVWEEISSSQDEKKKRRLPGKDAFIVLWRVRRILCLHFCFRSKRKDCAPEIKHIFGTKTVKVLKWIIHEPGL